MFSGTALAAGAELRFAKTAVIALPLNESDEFDLKLFEHRSFVELNVILNPGIIG